MNLIIAGCALGVVSERRETRQNRRVSVERPCQIKAQNGEWVDGVVVDVSSGGLSVRLRSNRDRIIKDARGQLRFTPYAQLEANELTIEVRNSSTGEDGAILGCQFSLQTPNDYRLMADLLYANSAQWSDHLNSRRRNMGLLEGTARFLWIAVFQTSRGLAYLVRFGQTPRAKSTRSRRAVA